VPIADIRPALRAFLLADATVLAAVGGTRIHPIVLPQGTNGPAVPAIVHNVISEVTDHHMQGASGLVMMRLQIDAYALTASEADALARAVKNRIDGVSGVWAYGSDSPQDSVTVQGCFAETARTDYQGDHKLFRSSRDYLIHYSER
jgi:uncharacterized protein DUF3168